MATWGEILNEFKVQFTQANPDIDSIRRKYLATLYGHTGRNIILYATNCTGANGPDTPPSIISISDMDVQGLMAVMEGLDGDKGLDLILHSPGGSPFAAEAMVNYLRSRFSDIRVIVPQMAMSAATMISCSGNSIVMGKHSSLGPIDPQMPVNTALGFQFLPAFAIREQFAKAVSECSDPSKMAAWLPMLNQYGPALLSQCDHAIALSEEIVKRWLKDYMFQGEPNALQKAEAISRWLADHGNFRAHGRFIPREELQAHGLKIEKLEDDQTFQDLVLSVFHSTTHTFTFTPAKKIIENHLGKAYVIQHGQVFIPQPEQASPPRNNWGLQVPRSQKKKKR